MKTMLLTAIGLSLGLVTAPEATAQTILQRLERRIRQRADATPPQHDPREPTAATRPEQPEVEAESGYIGLLVDDKQDRGRGVRVLEIRPAGPADLAGFRPRDVITRVEGARVSDLADLADVLRLFKPGDQVDFDVLRDGKQLALQVTVGRRPPPQLEAEPTPRPPVAEAPPVAPSAAVDQAGPALTRPTVPRAEPAATIEQLQQRIDQLERRVVELEKAIGRN